MLRDESSNCMLVRRDETQPSSAMAATGDSSATKVESRRCRRGSNKWWGCVYLVVIHGIGLLLAAAKTRAEGFGAGGPDQNLNITNLINLTLPLKLSHHPDYKSPCLSSARSSPA
jgi:hypothetical protein